MQLITDIEEITGSRLLVYITGDRRNLETRISSDVIPVIFKHVSNFRNKKISLFLYTPGGITISGFGIINLIREFCDDLNMIIPFRALSTGTLMALGCNSITMSKMGQLSPVDPSINHPLSPTVSLPQNPATKMGVPVNVEDVIGYFELAKSEGGIKSEVGSTEIFKLLSNNVHPVVLGAVNRARNQIKYLAKTLLSYHLTDQDKIDKIVKTLVEERFSHDYIIGRKEAKNELGLNIIDASNDLNEKVLQLFEQYSSILKLNSPYSHEAELATNMEAMPTFYRCIVESTNLTDVYSTQLHIRKIEIQQQGVPVTQYMSTQLGESWGENNDV